MWYVYIVRCADNSLYIGETSDVARRVASHNAGTAAFTSSRRPVRLVYVESVHARAVALKRERQLKRWTRAKKEALIAGDRALLSQL